LQPEIELISIVLQLGRPVMIRVLRATFAAFGFVLATAASAQSDYYVAVPAAAPTAPSLVTHVTSWKLQGTAYVAAKAMDRHQVLCRQLAAQTGPLTSFTVRGEAYDADALAQCNARAKPLATTASR
jgi:hypothetical protein